MKLGLWLALVGGVLFALALSVLPWQTFEIARVDASALELGGFGLVLMTAALASAGAAAWGLATGKRKPASQLVILAGLGLVLGLIVARANAAMGFDLMPYETVRAGAGWGLGLLAGAFVVVGGFVTQKTLATWDETSPLLRVAVFARDADGVRTVVADTIVYEPGTVRVRELISPERARGIAELPTMTVTPEGDVSLALSAGARLRMTRDGREVVGKGGRGETVALQIGDQAVIACADLEIMCGHVAASGEVGGRVPAPTLARSEVWSFGGAAAFALVTMAVAPVLAWTEEARIAPYCEVGMCAGVVTKVEPDEVTPIDDFVMPDPIEVEPERTSKAVGGPEGKLGDPKVLIPRENVVPKVDGPLVKNVDPTRIGLNALIDRELASTSSIAEVFRGDVAATTDRIAAAMDGEGTTLLLGPGRGLGFQGDEGGGPGDDGLGRILAQGEIDDGGPGGPGITAPMGPKPKKKVGVLDNGPATQSGYCKASNIQSVVKRRAGAIRACYEKSLQVKASLAGKVTVRWTIGDGGKVTNAASVGDTLGDAGTTRCVLDWVRRMTFDAPEGGMCVVQWPFVFSSGN